MAPNENLTYAATKMSGAVAQMARSDASLRQRILDAYREFSPIGLDMDGLPAEAVATFRALHARLTCLGDLGTERALCSFSDREVRRVADVVLELHYHLDGAYRAELERRAR